MEELNLKRVQVEERAKTQAAGEPFVLGMTQHGPNDYVILLITKNGVDALMFSKNTTFTVRVEQFEEYADILGDISADVTGPKEARALLESVGFRDEGER